MDTAVHHMYEVSVLRREIHEAHALGREEKEIKFFYYDFCHQKNKNLEVDTNTNTPKPCPTSRDAGILHIRIHGGTPASNPNIRHEPR